MWSHRPSFIVALLCASRLIHMRDWLLGRIPSRILEEPGLIASRHAIASGSNVLDAIYVEPTAQPARASVLICHGIAEVVTQWAPIQRFFANAGISSLVFDYSGYGRSTGRPSWAQCEQDGLSAFQLLRRLAPPGPVAILGFSLGTGVASAIVNRVEADRLVLCAGFSSFREATHAAGIPRSLSRLVPPVWDAAESLPGCKLPVLVVHSTGDRLFPVQMARDLASWCGESAELLIVDGGGHNKPFYNPDLSYWGPIIERISG